MKSRAELLREAADQPERLVEYIATLQAQLSQAQALIAELKRELFGAKADKLSPEQEEQLRQLTADVQEQNQRPPPLSRELLEAAVAQERAAQGQRAKERPRRHLPPVVLEQQQVILEPPDKFCPQSGLPRPEIGREVTTEYEYLPAKLILRQTVRPKYGRCGQPCCQTVSIAPLPRGWCRKASWGWAWPCICS
jgi:DNA repair exonuclease SbcCD ATPase subunit